MQKLLEAAVDYLIFSNWMVLLCDSNNCQFYQIAQLFHLLNSAYFINLRPALDHLSVFQFVFTPQTIPRHPTGNSKSKLLHYSLSVQPTESINYFMEAFQMVHISLKSGCWDPWSNLTKTIRSEVLSHVTLSQQAFAPLKASSPKYYSSLLWDKHNTKKNAAQKYDRNHC